MLEARARRLGAGCTVASDGNGMETTRCELCGRQAGRLERHHLIPRTRHRNRRNKRNFDRREVHERILLLCRACHSQLHATFSEKELEYDYNTLEAIRAHPDTRKFVRWVRKLPAGQGVCVRRKGGNDLRREDQLRRQRRKTRRKQQGQ